MKRRTKSSKKVSQAMVVSKVPARIRTPEPRTKPAACKMSASLAALMAASTKIAQPTMALAALGGEGPLEPPGAEPSALVFVRCTENQKKDTIAGIPLSGGDRRVQTALVPLSKMRAFASAKEVIRVSAPRQMRPLMDVAGPLTRVPQFRQKTEASGAGVIIGIVDSGIDANHSAFAGRILSIWDQTIHPGNGPGPGFPALGQVLQGPAMKNSKDTHGHGTHVAGIAAGAGPVFLGVAPKAELIIVKTNFQNSAISEGVRWIFAEAQRLGRPCVVNLSLGGHFDGHDGHDDTSVAISDECGSGRLVVAAAGNEGTDRIHVTKIINESNAGSFSFRVQPTSSAAAVPFVLLNGWYSGEGVCEIRVVGSNGKATPWQGLIKADPGAKEYQIGSNPVVLATPDDATPNRDRQFIVQIGSPDGGRVQGGLWKLEVRRKSGTPGVLHAWLIVNADLPSEAAAFTDAAFSHLVGSPGSASEVITVAAYTSRNTWKDLNGAEQNVGLPPDTIADFSSPGPLRNGALKPDVTAPGAMIASAYSSDSSAAPRLMVAADYRMNAGTSMASPLVAGMVSLLLEKQPNLTPAQAKEWLKERSSAPGLPAGSHNPKWGFGLIKL